MHGADGVARLRGAYNVYIGIGNTEQLLTRDEDGYAAFAR